MVPQNKNIDDCTISEIVDCLETQSYGEAACSLIDGLERMPHSPGYDWLRVSCVPYLFHFFEQLVPTNEDPVKAFIRALQQLEQEILGISTKGYFVQLFETASGNHGWDSEAEGIAEKTGMHYGKLFKEFTLRQYLEAKDLLEARLSRNNITFNNLNSCDVLDQGCGGGRYTVAWKLLGAKSTTGLDISTIGIEDAQLKTEQLDIKDMNWVQGSVLDMPFSDESFDIVYSNGVLHHTNNWQKGIEEQLRVMKIGGVGWQYLIEAPGGIFWDKIEILRAILRKVNKNFAAKVLASMAVPNNRIFYMLDHVMVPINTRLTPDQLESELTKAGAKQIRRLTRGTEFDRVEYLHKAVPFASIKFGVGENRYVFTK